MIVQANGIQRKVRVAVLILDKIDFKIKKVKKDTEGHFIMIKGIMLQEDITLINIYALNEGAPKYVKQLLTKLTKHHQGTNKPKHYQGREPKYLIVRYGQIIQTENQ